MGNACKGIRVKKGEKMIGEHKTTMGFKEMIIKEEIMAFGNYKMSELQDCRLIRELGFKEPQIRRILLNISKTLRQDPVDNPIFSSKIKTVGDVLFYFYAPAERYKYFEKIILDGKAQAGDFIQKSINPADSLEEVLRDDIETKAVFKEIQCITGRDYFGHFQEKKECGEMKTAQEFIWFLSNPENGKVNQKGANHSLFDRFTQFMTRSEYTREG